MRVLLDNDNYVMAYTLESVDTQGNKVGEASGIEVAPPKDLDHFQKYFTYYQLVFDDLIFDYDKYNAEYDKLTVLLDKDNYVIGYATIGNIEGGVEVDKPKDIDYFEQHYQGYFLGKSGLEFDEKKWAIADNELIIDNLRVQRERECFKYINRSQLWYDTLTKDQLEELQKWYNDWLNVTENINRKSLPKRPEWLK